MSRTVGQAHSSPSSPYVLLAFVRAPIAYSFNTFSRTFLGPWMAHDESQKSLLNMRGSNFNMSLRFSR